MGRVLTPQEFTTRAVGLSWERWRSDWQAVDCFGLVVLYFREVLGVDLGDVPHTDIATGFCTAEGWEACEVEAGAVAFMAWRDGAPTHCGIVLSPLQLLHSEGAPDRAGSVRVSSISLMRRVYGELRFYRRVPAC